MAQDTQRFQVDQSIDLRGVDRGDAFRKARERLQAMTENQILELHLDEGETLRSLPFGLRADGHEIVISEPAKEGVRLLVNLANLLGVAPLIRLTQTLVHHHELYTFANPFGLG